MLPLPRFPVFIPSKSRWDKCLTARMLDRINVPYRVIVEADQADHYRQHLDPSRLLILDPAYQDGYDPCDDLGRSKSLGPGPARNMAWETAISEGHAWHWVIDDNIWRMYHLNDNQQVPAADALPLVAMEDFATRYLNVAMVGPAWQSITPVRGRRPPFVTGTRIYSFNLIRNRVPLRWRGRYNEDTDLSLRMLKAGWATVQFNAFMHHKAATQALPGGNTEAFYAEEGTLPKSRMLVELHPDVARLTTRFRRAHHYVDYSQWRGQPLVPDPDAPPPRRLAVRVRPKTPADR